MDDPRKSAADSRSECQWRRRLCRCDDPVGVPLTPEQKRALRVELTRLKQILDDPDTDSIVELAIHNILGSAAAQSGYDLIEF